MGKWFGNLLPLPEMVLQTFDVLLFIMPLQACLLLFSKYCLMLALLGHLRIGAARTSGLFTIGKLAIKKYKGKSNVGSSYRDTGGLS